MRVRKWIDKVMRRLGYARWDQIPQGEVEFVEGDLPFVNLLLPGGNRVRGWVDPRNDWASAMMAPPNPWLPHAD